MQQKGLKDQSGDRPDTIHDNRTWVYMACNTREGGHKGINHRSGRQSAIQ